MGQGENFENHEYLFLDRKRNIFVKNTVNDKYHTGIWDSYGEQTREVWTDISYMQDEMKRQKYRFILVLNENSVRGVGIFRNGDDRNSYLRYKALKQNRR